MKYFVYFILLFCMIAPQELSADLVKNMDITSIPVSMEFNDEPLGKVLGALSTEADIAIIYDQDQSDRLVSGSLQEQSLQEALYQLFSNQNKSLIVFDSKRLIVVKCFGAKHYILAETVENKCHAHSGLTLSQLKEMHKKQYDEYKQSIIGENLSPEHFLTKEELVAMHEKQYQEYLYAIGSGHLKDESGYTLDELSAIHKEQYLTYQAITENEDTILENGMTRKELNAMHKLQIQHHRELTAGDYELFGSITYEELAERHAQQYNQYKQDSLNELF